MNKEVSITITLKEYEELSITKKKYEKLKEVIDKAIKLIEKAKERRVLLLLEMEVLYILKEVK